MIYTQKMMLGTFSFIILLKKIKVGINLKKLKYCYNKIFIPLKKNIKKTQENGKIPHAQGLVEFNIVKMTNLPKVIYISNTTIPINQNLHRIPHIDTKQT